MLVILTSIRQMDVLNALCPCSGHGGTGSRMCGSVRQDATAHGEEGWEVGYMEGIAQNPQPGCLGEHRSKQEKQGPHGAIEVLTLVAASLGLLPRLGWGYATMSQTHFDFA